MYHPYCHSPSALTEYLKQKLCAQRAKRLGRSLPTQVESNVQPKRNTMWHSLIICVAIVVHSIEALQPLWARTLSKPLNTGRCCFKARHRCQ